MLQAITHLGYVQIDTISIVERAHHHVLWSRVPDYDPAWLQRLQAKDRTVFEYWSHAAAFLPVSSYRHCLPRMRALAEGQRHWFARNRRVMGYVLDRIRAEGPLMARDFEAPRGKRAGPWFEWKPAKKALEQLFMEGTLLIRERRGFEKVFDLAERVLPEGTDTRVPDAVEHARHLVLTGLRAHGLATEPELRYLRRGLDAPIRRALAELEEDRAIVRVSVDGIAGKDALHYALPETLALSGEDASTEGDEDIRLLSPFDNAVIQRKRLKRLFGFDYQIECYLPEAKRRFGYFCLPILQGDRFIGRADLKADRASRTLQVRSLHYEDSVRNRRALRAPLGQALDRFARFNGCDRVAWP